MFKSIFNKKSIFLTVLFLFLAVTMSNLTCWAAPAGYSMFFVPGDEDLLSAVLDELDNATDETTHCVIGITSWNGDSIVYYDHWEDGYEFDPDNPTDYDEQCCRRSSL